MFMLLPWSTKIDSGVKLPHLVVCGMFWSMVLCVCMGFRAIGLCVLSVWASIGDRHLFKTWGLLEHGHRNPLPAFFRGQHLCKTRLLLDVYGISPRSLRLDFACPQFTSKLQIITEFGRYQIRLITDRCRCVWTTCPESLMMTIRVQPTPVVWLWIWFRNHDPTVPQAKSCHQVWSYNVMAG